MIRPEVAALVRRHSEMIVFLSFVAGGLWLATRGGWFLALLGLGVSGAGGILALGAWRRLRFRRAVSAQGVVEIVEGAVRFYGAETLGAEIALRDLVELRLLRVGESAAWRLRSEGGEALLIPVDAAGAAGLADAFTALPGLDLGAVSRALAAVADGGATMRTVWMRRG